MLSTPGFAGLATRLAAPARLLAIGLQRGGARRLGKSLRKPPALPLGKGAVLGRLHLPILPQSHEADHWAATVTDYTAMASAGQWEAVFVDLRQADQARKTALGGRALAGLISEGARAAVAAALVRQDWSAAAAEIALLADLQAAHQGDAMAACLLAQAHLDYAAARQKAEPGPGLPREVWKEVLHHSAMAEAILDSFDPIEEDSPLLAASRYQLVRGIDDGAAQCRDWYEDWSDLDPSNPEPHLAHAVHLLPNWFGTLGEFDAEARQAMRRTRHCSGAAAYALFHLAAAESLGGLSVDLEIALYVEGLIDHFLATGCQYRANITAASLSRLDHDLGKSEAGMPQRDLVRAALADHLRHSVKELHLSAWGPAEVEGGILHAFSQVFAEDFASGAHVYMTPDGLVARLPG